MRIRFSNIAAVIFLLVAISGFLLPVATLEKAGAGVLVQTRVNQAPMENASNPMVDFELDEDFGEYTGLNLHEHFVDDQWLQNCTYDFEYTSGGAKVKVADISNAAGVVTLHSTANWFGTVVITFSATDEDSATGYADVQITINSVNDAPVRTSIDFYSVVMDEGQIATYQEKSDPRYKYCSFLDLSLEFEDTADNEALTFGRTYKAKNPNVTADVDPGTGWTTIYAENEDWYGKETIHFWAKDAGEDGIKGNTDDAKIGADLIINIKSVNDPVIFNETPTFMCYEDQWFEYILDAYDHADGDDIRFATNIKTVIPGLGTNYNNFVFNDQTGKVKILGDNDKVGVYEDVWFRANDGQGSVVQHNITVKIINTNDAPDARITGLPEEGYYNTTMVIKFDGTETSDIDLPHGDELTYKWSSNKSGELGFGQVLNGTVPDEGLHVITLNVTDSAGASDETNLTIIVLKERDWGEAFIEKGEMGAEHPDNDNNDVFWYNASSQSGSLIIDMQKGNTEDEYDVTEVGYETYGNRIKLWMKVNGKILDSAGIQNTEMNYYLYFVKPSHQESPINVNVSGVTRPKVYAPRSNAMYGWIGLINGKVKWTDNYYSEDADVDLLIEDDTMYFDMYLADFERMGARPDFELFGTSYAVVSIATTAATQGAVWSFYDSCGYGAARAPNSVGNRVFKTDAPEKKSSFDPVILIFVALIVLAVIIVLVIIFLVVKTAKGETQQTYDYSNVKKEDGDEWVDFEEKPDDRYQTQNLYGETGQAAPVGAVAYQQPAGSQPPPAQGGAGGAPPAGQQPQGPPPQGGAPPAGQLQGPPPQGGGAAPPAAQPQGPPPQGQGGMPPAAQQPQGQQPQGQQPQGQQPPAAQPQAGGPPPGGA